MELTINHKTKYTYENNLLGLMQTTKLIPSPYNGLKLIEWTVKRNQEEARNIYTDAEANNIVNFSNYDDSENIEFLVIGKVETIDTMGVYKSIKDRINPFVYLRETILTERSDSLKDLARKSCRDQKKIEKLEQAHNLLSLVSNAVEYQPYTTNIHTTADTALNQGKGVCQDHAHIMIATSRLMNIPARYVNGYMHKNKNDSEFQATHAWAELYIENLGWIGFDPTNDCCPDERYIRVSCGLDASYAAPIRGIYYGDTKEKLDIHVQTSESSDQ